MWKILIVDDNLANRQLLIEIIGDLAKCDAAVNGREAVEAYNFIAKKYPLWPYFTRYRDAGNRWNRIFKNGKKKWKKSDIYLGNGMPVIMVTAFKNQFTQAFKHGCDDYITKPIDADKLIAKIKEKLEK